MSLHAADPGCSLDADAQRIAARVLDRINEASTEECDRRRNGEYDDMDDLGPHAP
jgi:hypothetical protein